MRIIMHGHHSVLLSVVPTLDKRVRDIREHKPAYEQKLRLRLIQDVTDLVPVTPTRAALDKTWAEYGEARIKYDKTRIKYDKTRAEYDKTKAALDEARLVYLKALSAYRASFDTETFHKQHCVVDCPWNGQTIFPMEETGRIADGRQ